MPGPRLYHEGQLAPGAKLRLEEAQAHKLTAVLRLGAGARIRLFNEDGEWAAEISAKDRAGLSAIVHEQLRAPASSPDIELLFAPLKRDATDLVIEKATELGIRRIRPVTTARTITDTVRLDRLVGIARSAAEQCERFDVPEIAVPATLAKALDGWDTQRLLIYADESGEVWGGARPPAIAAVLAGERPSAAALLTGPEGGFTNEERQWLRSLPFMRPVSLGPRILRAETAAIAALAILQSAWGDW